ncbi:unnamed protein product [Closterium sp. Naga37s-1]|nr:unnamed protein product [Closterium sp. Naga37s-1]
MCGQWGLCVASGGYVWPVGAMCGQWGLWGDWQGDLISLCSGVLSSHLQRFAPFQRVLLCSPLCVRRAALDANGRAFDNGCRQSAFLVALVALQRRHGSTDARTDAHKGGSGSGSNSSGSSADVAVQGSARVTEVPVAVSAQARAAAGRAAVLLEEWEQGGERGQGGQGEDGVKGERGEGGEEEGAGVDVRMAARVTYHPGNSTHQVCYQLPLPGRYVLSLYLLFSATSPLLRSNARTSFLGGFSKFMRGCAGSCGDVQVHAGMCRFMRGCAGSCGDVQVHAGMCRFMRGCAGSCGDVQVHAGMCRFMRGCAGSCGDVQVHAGMCRFMRGCAGSCGDVQVHAGMCRFLGGSRSYTVVQSQAIQASAPPTFSLHAHRCLAVTCHAISWGVQGTAAVCRMCPHRTSTLSSISCLSTLSSISCLSTLSSISCLSTLSTNPLSLNALLYLLSLNALLYLLSLNALLYLLSLNALH